MKRSKRLLLLATSALFLSACDSGNSSSSVTPKPDDSSSSSVAPVVTTIENYKIGFTFTNELPSYAKAYVTGEFNGWSKDTTKCAEITKGTDNAYTANIGTVTKGTAIEFKVCTAYTDGTGWTWGSDPNLSITPATADDYKTPINTTLNLPADPSAATYDVTFKITITDWDSETYSKVGIMGDFDTWTEHDMTASEETNGEFTYTYDIAAKSYEWIAVVTPTDSESEKVYLKNQSSSNIVIDLSSISEATSVEYTGSIASAQLTKVEVGE